LEIEPVVDKPVFIIRGLPLSRVGIDALSNDASSLDSEFNSGLGNSLNVLGSAEKAKRAGLTNMLGQFGNQQHIYSHLANSADKNKFYEELNAPKQKMKALYNIVNSGGNPDNMGPYGEAAAVKVLEKGLNLYNSPTPTYSGQQLANVPEELAVSHRLLGDLSHDYNDSSRGERDKLLGLLMGRENVGSRAIGDLPTIYDPQADKLDADTKSLLKAEKARISMDHERKGTYGSQSHLSQTEDAINRIAKSRFGNRNNLLQDVLRGRMSSLNKSDTNDLNQLNSLGQQGLSEYQDVLGKISGMNQLGVDKWLNTQDELNQKRERFEEERNQEWPGGSGTDIVKYNVSPEISSIFANPGVSSNPSVYTPSLRPNIHALAQYAQTVPVSHSETELESNLNHDMGSIKNYADFENTKLQKKREEEERLRLFKIAEENRIKQEEEKARIAHHERVRQEQVRVEQAKANDKQQKLKEIQDIRNALNVVTNYSHLHSVNNPLGKHAFYTPKYGELVRDFTNVVKNTQFKDLFDYDSKGMVADPRMFVKLDQVMAQYEEPKPLLVKGLNKEQWIQQIINNPNRKPNTPLPSMENLTKMFNDIALREQQTAKWREAWSK